MEAGSGTPGTIGQEKLKVVSEGDNPANPITPPDGGPKPTPPERGGGNGGGEGGGGDNGGGGARNLLKIIPRRGCIVLLLTGLAFVLVYGSYEAGRLGSARQQSEKKAGATQQSVSTESQFATSSAGATTTTPGKTSVIPLLMCLACALGASYLLALLLSINQPSPWQRHEVLSIAGVLSVLSGALMFGTWQLSEAEPNKGLFLVAANFLALSLLVLGLCYIPKAVAAMRGVQSPFLRLTVLLSVAGAAGGLGYHLVNHDGGLIIPELTKFEVVDRTPETESTTGANTASPSPRPSPSEIREKVTRPSFNIGFIGDIFLGIIAANALHIAMANLLDYAANGRPQSKQYFTVLALGILGGFAGARVLSSYSDKFLNEDQVTAIVKSEVLQQTGGSNPATAAIPDAAEVSQKIIDSMVRLQWPDESTLAQMAKFLQAVTASSKPIEKLSPDELLAAGGSDFFTKPVGSSTAEQYITHLLAQDTTPPNLRWTGRMLRVASVTANGTLSGRKDWYDMVLNDIAQFASTSALEDQSRARLLVSYFARLAAVIDGSVKISDLDSTPPGGAWMAKTESKPVKDAAILAKAITAYLKENRMPDQSAIPGEPIALCRMATAMRAVPKQFLEALGQLDSKKLEPTLRPFVEKAPSFPEDKQPRQQTTTTQSATPTATPSPTPSALGGPPAVDNVTPTPLASPTPVSLGERMSRRSWFSCWQISEPRRA